MITWADLIPVIAKEGIEVGEFLYQRWSSGVAPTQADFDKLRSMASSTGRDEMLATLKQQNIDPTSPVGVAFLALVS